MTRETVTVTKDNLTGEILKDGEAVEVEFTVHGQAYRMDLSKKNADEFYAHMADYEDVAERVEQKTTKTKTSAAAATPSKIKGDYKPSDVRAFWQRHAGRDGLPAFNSKGKIPDAVYTAFNEALDTK